MNRLAAEPSPYLRQHSEQPVDWYPWGKEAFIAAAELHRPVFISIGYSSCHWCHVMAHESFEDIATASFLNEHFVSVKVDREEHPDVDTLYMEAAMALAGTGGWPLSVFTTPDGRPFFAGTYFPKEGKYGSPAFLDVLRTIADAWEEKEVDLLDGAKKVTAALIQRMSTLSDDTTLSDFVGNEGFNVLVQARTELSHVYDPTYGGFGSAPKFPRPSLLELVLYLGRLGDQGAFTLASTTLDGMASGGIYDHLGGGFARYSTDRMWLVPHFEKMLYDQAGLIRAYLHGWMLSGRTEWLQVVEETIEYVLRRLRHPSGGVCSSEDADSEGKEGSFYLWDANEFFDILGSRRAPVAAEWYGVTAQGNFPGETGKNILFRPKIGDLIRPAEIEEDRQVLFEHREKRPHPTLDDKVITEWNAMFIAALAEAAAATGRQDWAYAAVEIAEFLLCENRREDGRWMRSWQRRAPRAISSSPSWVDDSVVSDGSLRDRNRVSPRLACAGDYAWLVEAFTRLYELTGQSRFLREAEVIAKDLLVLFKDPEDGLLAMNGNDSERLIVRPKERFDGAVPAANSVASVSLQRLGALLGDDRMVNEGQALIEPLISYMRQEPTAFAHALLGVELVRQGIREIVVTGNRPDLVSVVHRHWLPTAVLAWGERSSSVLWEGRQDGYGYVCTKGTCKEPVSTPEDLLSQLD